MKPQRLVVSASLIAVLAFAGYFLRPIPVKPSQNIVAAKRDGPAKTVMQVIAEDQAHQAGLPGLPPKDPELKMNKPGVVFKPEKSAPVARVLDDPEMGQVVELNYADGSKLYKMKDPVYNINTGEVSEEEYSN